MSRTRQVVYIILAGIFSGLILPDSTAAQQVGPPPREIDSSEANAIVEIDLHALQLTGSIDFNLDGQILEEFWSSAVPISDFTQQEPVEGGEPSETTVSPLQNQASPIHFLLLFPLNLHKSRQTAYRKYSSFQ